MEYLLGTLAYLLLRLSSLSGTAIQMRCEEHGKVFPHYRCAESDAWLDKRFPRIKGRVPRKVKKWHKKHGWTIRFTHTGKFYFTRDYAKFRVFNVK